MTLYTLGVETSVKNVQKCEGLIKSKSNVLSAFIKVRVLKGMFILILPNPNPIQSCQLSYFSLINLSTKIYMGKFSKHFFSAKSFHCLSTTRDSGFGVIVFKCSCLRCLDIMLLLCTTRRLETFLYIIIINTKPVGLLKDF